MAAENGHIKIIEMLLEDTGKEDIHDCASLLWAVQKGHRDLVEALIAKGVTIHAVDQDGKVFVA